MGLTRNARKPMEAFSAIFYLASFIFDHFLPFFYLTSFFRPFPAIFLPDLLFSTIFCHFSTWPPFFDHFLPFFLPDLLFRPLPAWLPRCPWCLTRGNRWLDFIFSALFLPFLPRLLQFIFSTFFGHFNPSSFFLIFLFWAICLECHDVYCFGVQSKSNFSRLPGSLRLPYKSFSR